MIRFLATLLIATVTLPAQAQSPDERGYEIARRAAERVAGYEDFTANGEMILRNAQGQESLRRFTSSSLEMQNDGDRTLFVFEWPGDIEGTALLTHAHKDSEDDQWLFLPALKRVKRISSANRSSSFVGSEFAYEDLVPAELEKYSYAWRRDEPCPDDPALMCHVYERRPNDISSGYTKQVVWRDQEAYRIQQIDYYDRRQERLKTLTVDGYELYEDRFWRPATMRMVNYLTGKSTEMRWSNYSFGAGLKESDFSTRALERVR